MNTNEVTKIAEKIKQSGGQAFLIGGCVRDEIMGYENKDIDIEVFGIEKSKLISILNLFGKVNLVGKAFGVIKLTTKSGEYDFSLPRRDSKSGKGHKGFIVEEDESMTLKEAAGRRDFTFNAISKNPLTGELHDLYGGIEHIKQKTIVHTSAKFGDDPLRVLRGMQFSARFGFTMSSETAKICKELKSEFDTLPKERLREEFFKLFEKGIKPSMGIDVLQQTGWLEFFPEIANLEGCEQDPEWHPEGDALAHTKHVMDEAARVSNNEDRLVLVLAALCHDMGKPSTTEFVDGRIRSRKHAIEGVSVSEKFMERIGTPNIIKDKVLELVREHMFHVNGSISKNSVRRLLFRMKHATIDELLQLMEVDHSGRPPLKKGLPDSAKQIKVFSDEIGNEVKPIMLGRHLIDLGMKPGKYFGIILREALEAQLDGKFDDLESGINFIENLEIVKDILQN